MGAVSDHAWAECRQRWPKVGLTREAFETWLDDDSPSADPAGERDIAGLYLARGCAIRDAGALEMFDERVRPEIGRALNRIGLSSPDAADVSSRVVERLLVEQPPRIGQYRGRGGLVNFVRAVAVRSATSQRRTAARRAGLLETLDAPEPDDPELAYLKQHYRAQFKAAFGVAVQQLDSGDRRTLRYRFVEALTLEQLAAVLGVHRATAARSLARIRQELLDGTRRGLRESLDVGAHEFESIVRLIQSNFDVSVRRLLDSGSAGPE